jgi:hypothetical protein
MFSFWTHGVVNPDFQRIAENRSITKFCSPCVKSSSTQKYQTVLTVSWTLAIGVDESIIFFSTIDWLIDSFHSFTIYQDSSSGTKTIWVVLVDKSSLSKGKGPFEQNNNNRHSWVCMWGIRGLTHSTSNRVKTIRRYRHFLFYAQGTLEHNFYRCIPQIRFATLKEPKTTASIEKKEGRS